MKVIRLHKIFSPLIISIYFLCGVAKAEDPFEIVSDIIGLYQPISRETFGMEIFLWIEPSNERPNAFASFRGPGGSPRIRILSSMLDQFKDSTISATVCHELGHFFGDRSMGQRQDGLALEAEADYFAGSCLVRYLSELKGFPEEKAEVEAIEIAQHEAQAFERRRLDANRARTLHIEGVELGYPEPECRLLTVIHGIRAIKRPDCWYNPRAGLGS